MNLINQKQNSVVKRNTKQKQLILETIRCLYHPSCEEIYDEVHKSHPKVSRGTVFRNVNSLVEDELLIHIPIANKADRYEVMTKEHTHFICDKCGEIYDIFYVPEIRHIESNDFLIKSHELIFRGICKKCLEKEEK